MRGAAFRGIAVKREQARRVSSCPDFKRTFQESPFFVANFSRVLRGFRKRENRGKRIFIKNMRQLPQKSLSVFLRSTYNFTQNRIPVYNTDAKYTCNCCIKMMLGSDVNFS